jgi:type II restriction/modification system DNA methylase subunit YeeA
VLNPDGSETKWPEAEFIIGNPPFLGNKRMISVLGESYTGSLRKAYEGRVPGGADRVIYWFEKARTTINQGKAKRVGLVSTQAIRAGANRSVLERVKESEKIFEAWSDEPWIVEGAAVRVSLVCFSLTSNEIARLDGKPVSEIFPDLTARDILIGADFTRLNQLPENLGKAFQGPVKVGPFDIPGNLARSILQMPLNPNGRPNSDVVKPWANGMDITRRPADTWIVDFGEMREAEASLYEAPFEYVRAIVKPMRDKNRRARRQKKWWQHGETVPGLRDAVLNLARFIITPRVAKYRLFAWANSSVVPDSRLYAIAREDDTTFGILHSRFHQVWSLATCSWHGDGEEGGRPTYNAHSCFGTFPFPQGITPDIPVEQYANDPKAQKIAAAARHLSELRNNWLNPPDLIMTLPEVVKGYPDRVLPKDEAAAQVLKQRTLTNLYNERSAWLDNAHRDLDAAVADAYGWKPDMSDDEMLIKLLALNLERAK